MSNTDELLQRCFDGDLNDEESQMLFTRLSAQRQLREEFRALADLKNNIRGTRSIPFPRALDDRIRPMFARGKRTMAPDALSVRGIFRRRLTIPVPAFAVLILIMIAGILFSLRPETPPQYKTEVIYLSEMPTYVVQSTVVKTVNN